ncbi:MAG: hypothetical protein J7K68_05450 [Candidatus Diapherotrites archaeon]|nr:hypothetical protein [Candidatus Diapherotrites archaeon]
MEIAENKPYLSYILIGLLYFISKATFYVFDFVSARIFECIATAQIALAFLMLKDLKKIKDG